MSRFKLINILLVISVIVGFVVAYERMLIEKEYKKVEIAVDYSSIKEFANANGYLLDKLLNGLRSNGVNTIAVNQVTMEELEEEGKISVYSMQEIMKYSRIGVMNNPNIKNIVSLKYEPTHTYVFSESLDTLRNLEKNIQYRYGEKKTSITKATNLYRLEINVPKELLMSSKIMLPNDLMLSLANKGFNIVPRVANYSQISEKDIKEIIKKINSIPHISTIIFDEDEILGYPTKIKILAREIKKYDNNVGIVEFFPQKGMDSLAREVDNHVIRVHSLGAKEMENLNPTDARERLLRAVKERNIRLIYMRPFMQMDKPGDIWKNNLKYFNQVSMGLKDSGFVISQAEGLPKLINNQAILFCLFTGIGAGIVLLISKFTEIKSIAQIVMILAVSLLLLALYLKGYSLVSRQIGALIVAFIFPSLAVINALNSKAKFGLYRDVIITFGKSVLITLIGAIILVGLLGDWFFMIKLKQFAGVKLAHIIPIFIVMIYFFWNIRLSSTKKNLPSLFKELYVFFKEFLDKPVLFIYVFAILIIGIAGIVYILRTGNVTDLPVLGIEMKFRNLLDKLLFVRPRTKEFLIGHPAMIAAIAYYYWKMPKYYIPLFLVGLIGQISVLNTFSHVHTPLMYSIIRVFNGVWLGCLLGLLLVFIINKLRQYQLQL